jgi:hypothetical protein
MPQYIHYTPSAVIFANITASSDLPSTITTIGFNCNKSLTWTVLPHSECTEQLCPFVPLNKPTISKSRSANGFVGVDYGAIICVVFAINHLFFVFV